MRNNIQKMKIDMANEVIDAGRFDMNTTMEERRETLEALLAVRLHGFQSILSGRAYSRLEFQWCFRDLELSMYVLKLMM